jgi:hypothetical protein
VLRTIEVERSQGERRQSAVAEIREHLTKLYRGFVGWAALYGKSMTPTNWSAESGSTSYSTSSPSSTCPVPCGSWKGTIRRSSLPEQGGRTLLRVLSRDRSAGLTPRKAQHGKTREQEAETTKDGGRVRPRSRTRRAPPPGAARAIVSTAAIQLVGTSSFVLGS